MVRRRSYATCVTTHAVHPKFLPVTRTEQQLNCRGRLQGNAKVAPVPTEVHHDRVHDLPTKGFAAPVRDGHPPPHALDDSETMARLDELLSSIGTGMDGWDGDGVFAPDGRAAAGKRKKGDAGSNTRAGGGGADDHADWSRDGTGYFGGTAADYDAGVAPGSGLGGAAAGQPMSQELEDQVQALKSALEVAKRKLARSRGAEEELRAKHAEKASITVTLPLHYRYITVALSLQARREGRAA